MNIVAERLRYAMQVRELKQVDLVAKTGIGKSSISTYLSGEYLPKQTNTYKLAKALSVNPAWLLGEDVEMEVPSSTHPDQPLPPNVKRIADMHVQRVPIIGSVAAGVPILAEQEYDTYIDAPAKADFALRVDGDSMEPIYLDGDIIYIRQQDDVYDGQIGVAIMDDHAALKYIYHIDNGLNLISANPKYPPRQVTYDMYDVIRILGLACGYTRMHHN